jgi:guanylate kinase
MAKVKVITISGPSNAGKDSVVQEIKQKLELEHFGKVYIGRYFTTRTDIRPGEKKDEYFLSEEEFEKKKQNGEFVFFGNVDNYRVGSSLSEYDGKEIVIMNIAPQFVEKLKEIIQQRGGECLSFFISADKEERVLRGQLREGWLFPEIPRHRVENDIVKEGMENSKGIDFVVENREDRLNGAMAEIMPKVEVFLK